MLIFIVPEESYKNNKKRSLKTKIFIVINKLIKGIMLAAKGIKFPDKFSHYHKIYLFLGFHLNFLN